MRCILIGTGDMAHALARQYAMTPKDATFHSMAVASPTRDFVPGHFFDTEIPFVDLVTGMQEADILILAIPGYAMSSFIALYADYMKDNKLIIDINNDKNASGSEFLSSLRWVKGFNDCGAIDLLGRKNKKSKPKTRISGVDVSAVLEAKKFAEEVLGFDVTIVEHSKRKVTEQDTLGKEWKHAAYIALALYLALLAVITTHYYKRWPFPYDKDSWPVTTQNKIVSCVAVGLFALSVMPGCLARLIQSWKNDSLYVLHPSLIWALSIRKHLGLMGLYFLFVHAIMSLVDFSPATYYWWAYDSTELQSMNLTGQVSMMFAIYSTSLFVIVGLCSLPSVGEAMNKKQWSFVFGPVVWLALVMGHVHYCVIYFRVIKGSFEQYGSIPHATLLGSLLPWLAFLLKFVQLCVTYGFAFLRKLTCHQKKCLSTVHTGYAGKKTCSYKDRSDSLKDTQHESVH